jgi:aminobenzoyl-glutamate utilization protein B
MKCITRVLCVVHSLVLSLACFATDSEEVLTSIESRAQQLTDLSDHIWDLAEVGYQETLSSNALKNALLTEGFSIETGVASIPTAFVASYGSGQPVIAIMGEFDALPGISQAAVPVVQKIDGKKAAHACGHHLFGAGSVGAAIAVKEWLGSNRNVRHRSVFWNPRRRRGAPARSTWCVPVCLTT